MGIDIPGIPFRIIKPTEGAPTAPLPGPDSLVGVNGNAYAVMAYVERVLKRAGASPEYIASYHEQATSGDYDRLLSVSMTYLTGDDDQPSDDGEDD